MSRAASDLGPLFSGLSAPAASEEAPAPSTGQPILRSVFGHDAFRPGQDRAVRAFIEGRDVEVVLPTGGGKSVCYQVPAVHLARSGAGPTLVVSPLVALMQDQVAALRRRGVRAAALHRALDHAERRRVEGTLGEHALIYASPERLAGTRFRRQLAKASVSRVAIDEAHCISEWGHDFRKDYLTLGALKEVLGVPTMALTATATPRVMEEVRQSLSLEDPVSVWGSFDRPNLHLSVEHHRGDNARTRRVAELLRAQELGRDPARGRVVIYAATRKRVRAVSDALRKEGFKAGYYHAGRTTGARERAQRRFESGDLAVLVATTAFGMGIDLPDVRMVVHVQAPSTLEAYYQQAGRAGRDGEPSSCVLLYAPGDSRTQNQLMGASPNPGVENGWRAMQDYAYGTVCRQAALVSWFTLGGLPEAAPDEQTCGTCDVCTDLPSVRTAVQTARSSLRQAAEAREAKRRADSAVSLTEAQQALVVSFVDALRKPIGRTALALGLRGSKAKRLKRLRLQSNPHFGALKSVPEVALVRGIDQLLECGRLVRKGRKYPTVWLPDKRVRPRSTGAPKAKRPAERGLPAALRSFRSKEARRRRWRPFQVFPDKLLRAIVEERPATPAELLALPGMGSARMAKFGSQLLELVRDNPA
ncbi:MAG: ATP-dependent DNA helicase [Myxococcales bacterium]|nr:ATP-dependent DNA helicase [Myxococcales bacterium]